MFAFYGLPALKFTILEGLKAEPFGKGQRDGYLDTWLPQERGKPDILGIPITLVREASDIEGTMRLQGTRHAWSCDFIESIRPLSNLTNVPRRFAEWRLERAYVAKEIFLNSEQREAVSMVRKLTADNDKNVELWREALRKITEGIFAMKLAAAPSSELSEWHLAAISTEGTIRRLSDANARIYIDYIAWVTAKLAHGLLDPWWNSDSATVSAYGQKLLEFVRSE